MSSNSFTKIYEIIKQIPKGKVATYGQIAAMAGNPRAARMVGWALHGHSGDEIPWHRVINASGRSSFPLDSKRKLQQALLEGEGVQFDLKGRIDLDKFQWQGSVSVDRGA